MRFSTTIIPTLAALAQAGVFTQQSYDAISISGGTAGNGEAEALAVFDALDMNNLAAADADDIAFLKSVNSICNDAETEAFNPAIAAATGAEKAALEAGKTKNKILKLEATMIRLKIEEAQGDDVASEIAAETKKLNNNISADEGRAGSASTALDFDAQTA